MKKDFPKKQATRQMKYKRGYRFLYLLFFILFISAVSVVSYIVLYQPKIVYSHFVTLESGMTYLQKWLSNKEVTVHSKINKAKKIVDTKLDLQPAIQFEFYKTLPEVEIEKTLFADKKEDKKKEVHALFDEKQIQNAFNEEFKNFARGVK